MSHRGLIVFEVVLCSIGLMVFSFFIQSGFPAKILSFAAVLVSGFIIGKSLRTSADILIITGDKPSPGHLAVLLPASLLTGFVLSILYRWHIDVSVIPVGIHGFAFIAAIIGITEELIFRGYIQGNIKEINVPLSIIGGSLAHTGYKCCLFLAPAAAGRIDTDFLALWTMIAGIIFGTINHFSKSIIPSVAAHALFDILVYAEFSGAPWWVW